MADPRFARLRETFDAALDRPAAERESFVRASLADDAALADEILALLADHGRAEAFFDGLETRLQTGRAQELHQHWSGDRELGPYRLLRTIGSGGMGTVYLAERCDGQFERQVAIKVLPPGIDSAALRRRFDDERRILAALSHPNIAQLFDAGVSEDGRPYLVLEYVQGEDLAAHVRARRLGARGAVELLARICDAVQFAHQHLVVHRDLKPSNILVRADGVPKLLDFGIARLLEVNETTTLGAALTPAYAAPEQFRGHPASTGTDVFALGVLLFELLAGERPDNAWLRGDDAAPEPPRLARVRPDLRGDLDAVAAKAMRYRADERYASAAQLGDDLRRWLDGEPVLARRAGLRHRVRLWTRRHPALAAGGTLALAGVIGFAIYADAQARRIAAERDRAEALAELLVDVFTSADPAQSTGRTVAARELLDRGVPKLRARTDLDPETRARLAMTLGRAYLGLAQFEPAGALLEEALAGFDRNGPNYAAALVHRGERARLTGKLDDAEKDLRAAVATLDAAGEPQRKQALWARAKLGRLLAVKGDNAGARAILEEVLAATRALPDADARLRAERLNDLASVDFAEGKFADAQRRLDEVVALQRDALPVEQREKGGADLATALNNLGLAHMQQGARAPARTLFEQALAMRRAHLPAGHPELAQTLTNLGLLNQGDGALDAAEPQLREALAIRREAYASSPGHPQLAQALNNLALVLQAQARYDEAEALFREALAALAKALGPAHPLVATAENNLGSVLLDRGNSAEAEPHFASAVALRAKLLPPDHPYQAYSLIGLGIAWLDLGRTAEAADPIVRGHAIRSAKLPVGDPLRAEADYALGALRLKQGKADEGRALLAGARAALEKRPGSSAVLRERIDKALGE